MYVLVLIYGNQLLQPFKEIRDLLQNTVDLNRDKFVFTFRQTTLKYFSEVGHTPLNRRQWHVGSFSFKDLWLR